MIKELQNFTEKIENELPEIFSWNIKPSEGLHIFLNMKTGYVFDEFSFFNYSQKNNNDSNQEIIKKIIKYESNARRIGTNMNKAYHKKLFACNPFIISFKKKTFSVLNKEDFESFIEVAQEVAKLNPYEIKITNLFVIESLKIKENKIKELEVSIEIEKKVKKDIIKVEKNENIFSTLKDNDYINFYLESYPDKNGNIQKTNFSEHYQNYLNQKGFNQDKEEYKIGEVEYESVCKYHFFTVLFQQEKNKQNKLVYTNKLKNEFQNYEHLNSFGISDYLNGLNSKKPYLEHKTAMFQKGISQYIDGATAMALFKFELLVNVNKALPNPLPIMIWNDDIKDNRELEENIFLKEFNENITIIKDKEIRIGFIEILRNLFEKNSNFKLSNFYLFNYLGGKLRDFDFVESFQYNIQNLEIKAIFNDDYKTLKNEKIKTVFEFERKIVFIIFDYGLVGTYKLDEVINKEKIEHIGYFYRYFDDLKESNYKGNMFLLITKYRKAFYDFIYKSNRECLTGTIIKDILSVGLLDDIKFDEYKNNKNTNKYKIYRKLNIWFSVYDYISKNKNETMASKIEKLKIDFIEIINGTRSLQDGEDELFAYSAGQVIYYIHSKSKSADKSYAKLEPFLSRLSANQFKATLMDEFDKYKHEKYSKEFNNPFAQINIFPLEKNMRDLLPFFLGGYFSKNLLFPGSVNQN